MPNICSILKLKGYCTLAGCSDAHPEVCAICTNIKLLTDQKAHDLSNVHLRSVFQKGALNPQSCRSCSATFDGSNHNFVQHYKSTEHAQKCAAIGASVVPQISPVATKHCRPCGRLIQGHTWAAHIRGSPHVSRLAKLKVSKRTADQVDLQESVEISSPLGFRYSAPTESSIRNLVLHVVVNKDIKVDVLDARLESETSGIITHFKIIKSSLSVSKRTPGSVTIEFRSPAVIGLHTDVLLFYIKQPEFPTTVLISTKITAAVIHHRILEEAQINISPNRGFRGGALPSANIFKGQRLLFATKVLWTRKLAEYPVPNALRDINVERKNHDEEIIGHLERLLPPKIDSKTHKSFWQTLLFVEELQHITDMELFSMSRIRLNPEAGGLFSLDVPGLAERRPSVLLGDTIKLHKADSTFVGYVYRVESLRVMLRLHAKFDHNALYDVDFVANRSSFRRIHQALSLNVCEARLVFPSSQHVLKLKKTSPLRPFDTRLLRNNSQTLAVSTILRLPQGSPPFIVFGPPGTGKTVVVVEAILQALAKHPESHILACAPSNAASDEIAQRLAAGGLKEKDMFRLNALTRPSSELPPPLVSYSSSAGDRFNLPKVQQLRNFRVVVSTCISASLLSSTGVELGHYSYIFVDEAGYASEPEALLPILNLAGPKTVVILSGDPKQLGPMVRSPFGEYFGFGQSYLERLMNLSLYTLRSPQSKLVVKLVNNYRSHPAILRFPNDTFYEGELVSNVENAVGNRFLNRPKLGITDFPVIFHAVQGEDMREKTSPSFLNPYELSVLSDYLNVLLAEPDIFPEEIGIISPYSAHNRHTRRLEVLSDHSRVVKVGTVESFQAQERPIIVLSTVRSNPEHLDFDIRHALGFVASPKRLNVAITRARSLLIIIGDPAVLSRDQVWNELLHYVRNGGGWRGMDFNLPSLEYRDPTLSVVSNPDHVGDFLAHTMHGLSIGSHDPELPLRESE